MTDRAITAYRKLFEVRLLHHYWLDSGAAVFDTLPAAVQQKRLLAYDVRGFLEVRPTPSTAALLQGFAGIFRSTALGFIVAAPRTAAIDPSTLLSFTVSVTDSRFYRYTALTLRPQKIFQLVDPTDTTVDRARYRFKENVPVLSNLTGVLRGGGDPALFLSRDIPAPDGSDRVEALVKSGTELAQLTSDNPAASTQTLGSLAGQPLYVTQADAPPIVAPAGISGAPARGVMLSDDLADDVFALIRISALNAGNDAFSFVEANGTPKATPPVYQLRFKNRATLWRYRNKQDGTVIAVEPAALPLTHFGNAGTRQKPSGLVQAEMNGQKVTRLVSEVYV